MPDRGQMQKFDDAKSDWLPLTVEEMICDWLCIPVTLLCDSSLPARLGPQFVREAKPHCDPFALQATSYPFLFHPRNSGFGMSCQVTGAGFIHELG